MVGEQADWEAHDIKQKLIKVQTTKARNFCRCR